MILILLSIFCLCCSFWAGAWLSQSYCMEGYKPAQWIGVWVGIVGILSGLSLILVGLLFLAT